MFENILGHEEQKKILLESLKNGNISHSYLFFGPKGIGKCTLAKEFAKNILGVNNLESSPDYRYISKKEDKKEDKTQLKKGSNHSIEASDYAYDVTAVNNTIRGKSDDVKGKVVFLTFDDGIDPTLTPQVMNILKEYGVHATFFHIGYTITSENGDILKRQITEDMSLPTTVLAIISICSIQDVFQIKVKLFLRLTKPMPISKPS